MGISPSVIDAVENDEHLQKERVNFAHSLSIENICEYIHFIGIQLNNKRIKIKNLKDKIKALELENLKLKFSPGGPGMLDAKKEFESISATQH